MLFAIFGLLMAVLVVLNVIIAYRLRPAFRGMSAEQQNLDRYRVGLDPYKVPLLLGIDGLSASWRAPRRRASGGPGCTGATGSNFGPVVDPQFNKDVSFYVFDYPWWRFVLGFFFAVALVSILAAVVTHYLYGGLRLQTPGEKSTPAAQAHLSVLLGVFVLLKAVAYWMDRYGLAVPGGGFERVAGWTGLRYKRRQRLAAGQDDPRRHRVDLRRAVLRQRLAADLDAARHRARPAGALRGADRRRLPGDRAAVQGPPVRGRPVRRPTSTATSRRPERRTAWTGPKSPSTTPRPTTTAGALRGNADTTASIRLLDPNIVSPTFQQQQQIRGFYSFPDTLNVDRYTINGENQDVVAAVRELNLGSHPAAQRNWISDHLIYTHGYGFVAARGNTVNADGEPTYVSSGIPTTACSASTSRGSTSVRSPRSTRSSGAATGRTASSTIPTTGSPTASRTTPTPARVG